MAEDELTHRLYLSQLRAFDKLLDASPRLKYALDHHRNTRGERMVFTDKAYLIAILTDQAPQISMQACVQVGKSEILMVSCFYYSERGLQVMYTLPDDNIRNLFVANRIDTTISRVAHYKANLRPVAERGSDSRGLKHFGKGSIFFTSSNASSTFIEKPLDVIIADELDKFDLKNYELSDDRLSASPYKIKYEAANPTVDSHGIAVRFRESDRRRWHLRCAHCGHRQPIDWFENIVETSGPRSTEWRLRDREWAEGCGRDVHMMCRSCKKPMDRLADGEWVAEFPTKALHGYHLSQLMAKHVTLSSIWERYLKALGDDTKMQVFFNSGLGVPFAGAGAKVTEELLNACKEDYLMPGSAEPCFMGVDVGKKLHVSIRQIVPGERLRSVFIGTVPEFEDLDNLIARYNIVTFAIDAMPETRKATDFVKKHPNKGWIVRYQSRLEEVDKKEDDRVLSVDRTQIMDRVLSFYRRRAFIIPRNAHLIDKGDYYRMMKAPTRIYDADKNKYDWLGGPDHYFHAEVYCLLAYVARGEFRVWGMNIAQGAKAPDIVPESVEALKARFPPGTDPKLIEHYVRLFEKMKEPQPTDRIVGAFEGTIND